MGKHALVWSLLSDGLDASTRATAGSGTKLSPMAGTVEIAYHGPPVTVVELEREVCDGDTFDVDEALASRLLCAAGFSGPARVTPADGDAVKAKRDADAGIDPDAPDQPNRVFPEDEGYAEQQAFQGHPVEEAKSASKEKAATKVAEPASGDES